MSLIKYFQNKAKLVKEGEQERYISYLPLAHMFERVCQVIYLNIS